MSNVQELVNTLEVYLEDDTTTHRRELVVTNQSELNKVLLDEYNIRYISEGNSTRIYLDNKNIRIFKSYEDAIKYSNLEDASKLNIALNIEFSQKVFFENITYFERIKTILDDENLVDFKDKIKKDYFILSNTYGKIILSYAINSGKSDFYETKHYINLEKLETLLKTDAFPEFYKDAIAKLLSNNPDKSLYSILMNFDFLLSNALNSLSLYKQNFSFEEFEKEFEKEFDKNLSSNIKKLQELTTGFHSKIMAIPIQFGVYIYLLSRFNDNCVSMLLVMVTIIAWAIFNYLITSKTYRNVNYLENKVKGEIALIKQNSGIIGDRLSKPQKILSADIYTMKNIINIYQVFSAVFTFLILIIFALN